MDNIKDIIVKVIGNMAAQKGGDFSDITRVWPTVIEKKALAHTKVVGTKDGIVLINVDSSAWLYQLNINRTKILKKLQSDISDIKNIRFKIGKVS